MATPVNAVEPVDALDASPLYRRVVTQLTDKLAAGEWKPGHIIPSESRLAQQFQVSIGTLRKAIDELVAERVLVRHQGRGTFVATHSRDRFLFRFFHIVGNDDVKRFPRAKLIHFRRGRADARAAAALGIARGARVVQIRNVLTLDDEPVVLDDITLPAELFPGLSETIFRTRSGTIYHLYHERYGVNVVRTTERVRAIAAKPDAAATLGVHNRTPILEIERTAFSYRDRPVEWRRSRVNTAKHHYLNSLIR